jgi:glyoxylase-like metal-dependent hydrolase (beta-lactamase superfamily II)
VYLHEADRKNVWLTVKPDTFFTKDFELSPNLEVIHTPGHSPGSVSLWDRRNKFLFCGDTVGGDGRGGVVDFIRDDPENDLPERLRSVERLSKIKFEKLLPFHYRALGREGQKILSEYAVTNRGKV